MKANPAPLATVLALVVLAGVFLAIVASVAR